jgi:hypothetical protein
MGRPSTGNAKTPAQRMAEYRARKIEEGDGARLSLLADVESVAALRRLAAHYGETQAETFKKIILKAESETLASMSPAERKTYRAN